MTKFFGIFFCTIIFSIFVIIYLNSSFNYYSISCFSQKNFNEDNNFKKENSLLKQNNSAQSLDYIELGSDHVFNLPRPPYILGMKNGPRFLGNKSCAPFPAVFNVKFNNVIWQLQEQSNWTFYLFGAYWDIRTTNKDAPSIRVLTMMNKRDETVGTNYCQIWFANQTEPLISEITSYNYLWVKSWGNYNDGSLQPYLLNCPMPKNYTGSIPTSVSVVSSPCTPATNNLRVHFEKPTKKQMFAVCVKGMDFISPDWSTRLVEWIEMLLLLGVHKIFFYDLAVHPNVQKVFRYYENLDKIQVLPLTTAGGIPNDPHLRHAFLKKKIIDKRQHELIPYNDCLYRNMYNYEFISLLDIDEIIVPHNEASTWSELVQTLLGKDNTDNIQYFVFANVHFVADEIDSTNEHEFIPDYFYMLQHTVRISRDAGKGSGIKCFHRPENILTLHNHFPTSCISQCPKKFVNQSDAFLHHYSYRVKKIGAKYKDNTTVTYFTDQTMWRWKNELITQCNIVLRDLDFI